MLEHLEGRLEAGVEFECSYCWVAGMSHIYHFTHATAMATWEDVDPYASGEGKMTNIAR